MTGDSLDEVMEMAYRLPDSPRKVEILEEAVRIADAHYDRETALRVRLQLLDSATFGGRIERSIVAFGWILARYDEEPDCLDLHTLLWRYKWIVANVVGFAAVSKERILEMEDDMERRFLENGFSLQVVYEKRYENAKLMGNHDRAWDYFQKWLQADRDSLSDCLACDQNHRVEAFAYFGQIDEAFEAAEPLLNGRMSCRTTPQVTYATLMLPAIQSGKPELAKMLFDDGYHLIQGKPNFLREAARHLYYLVWAGRMDEALKCFWQHLPLANQSLVDSQKIDFYLSAACMFQALETDEVQVSDPMLLPTPMAQRGTVARTEILKWANEQASKIATAFDRRNGNSYWTQKLDEIRRSVLRKSE